MHDEISSHYQSWKRQKTISLCDFSWDWHWENWKLLLCAELHRAMHHKQQLGVINTFEQKGKNSQAKTHEWRLHVCIPI